MAMASDCEIELSGTADRVATSSMVSTSTALRGALVGVACAADVVFNYPLWITSKRLGAGLGAPRGREIYKGGGTVWLSLFPTMACEDFCSRFLVPAVRAVAPSIGHTGEELVAAAAGGVLAGVAVAAPIENLVTRAHRDGTSIGAVLRTSWRAEGIVGIAMPLGQAAMVGREVPWAVGCFFFRDYLAQMCHSAADDPRVLGKASSHRSVRWWAEEVISSMACSTLVGIVSHPSTVVLAQQQAHDLPFSVAIRKIYNNGGARGFYVGFISRAVSIGGSMFVIPTVLSFERELRQTIGIE